MPTLTRYLTQLRKSPTYEAATIPHVLNEIKKIVAGGKPDRLSLYLAQLRVCVTHGYPRFISSLIARIPFDSNDPIHGLREEDNQSILLALTARLTLFTQLAVIFEKLDAFLTPQMGDWVVRDQTKALMADMIVVAQTENALENGLVFLWATETMILDTWVNALLQIIDLPAFAKIPSKGHIKLGELSVMLNKWLSPKSKRVLFDTNLADLIDNFGTTSDKREWDRAVMFWKLAVETKIGLWPAAGEVDKWRKHVPIKPAMTPPEKALAGKGFAALVANSAPVVNEGFVGAYKVTEEVDAYDPKKVEEKVAAGDSKSTQGDDEETPADDEDVRASKTAPATTGATGPGPQTPVVTPTTPDKSV